MDSDSGQCLPDTEKDRCGLSTYDEPDIVYDSGSAYPVFMVFPEPVFYQIIFYQYFGSRDSIMDIPVDAQDSTAGSGKRYLYFLSRNTWRSVP